MHSDAKRYYAILGVDPACSDEEIRQAFRRRAKELHPDSESGSASAFIRLKRAYDTLGDRANRARYDRAGWAARLPKQSVVSRPTPQSSLRPARPPRPGGLSFRRYAVAFAIMAALSFGAIQVMISLADVPPGSTIRQAGPALVGPSLLERNQEAKGKDRPATQTGFWDPTSPDGTPRDPSDPQSGQFSSEQSRTGQSRTGQSRTGQSRTGQSSTGPGPRPLADGLATWPGR